MSETPFSWIVPAYALGPEQIENIHIGPLRWSPFIRIARRLFPPPSPKRDSGHYHMPREERCAIVTRFWRDKRAGQVVSRQAWARNHLVGHARTLSRWLAEFPELRPN